MRISYNFNYDYDSEHPQESIVSLEICDKQTNKCEKYPYKNCCESLLISEETPAAEQVGTPLAETPAAEQVSIPLTAEQPVVESFINISDGTYFVLYYILFISFLTLLFYFIYTSTYLKPV